VDYKNHIEHYKKDAEFYDFFTYDKFLEQEHRRRYEAIFNLHKIKDEEKILEIGSGAGHALKHIKSASFFPLDVSSFNLKRIKKNAGKPVYPVSGDVYNLPFETGSFDFIILSEVLEHLDKPEEALKEIFRVLIVGGVFIVSVPYKEKLTYQICIHCNKPTPTYAHLHVFDKPKLSTMVQNAGFRIEKTHKFLNKIPNRLHVNRILKFLPYKYWKIIDSFSTSLMDKPASIMVVGTKEKS
jgi:ubiquinone/menaquinone biosynthesis C-methylase UbiE